MSIYVFVYHRVCMVAFYSDPDPFGEIRICYGRFGVVLVMDPIQWRFEDRPMIWSRDSYQFVRWRPDNDSIPKSRHFMWMFVLMLFSYLSLIISNCVLLALFHVGNWYIFPVYYYLHHFMRHQWVHTLCIQLIWVFICIILCGSLSPLLIQDYLWYTVDCELIWSTQLTYSYLRIDAISFV